jgi:hypothetical protein
MRRLVADKGELGEDHSECNGNQRLQPGVVEEDQPGHRITQRGQQTSEEEYNQRARPLQPGLRTACNAKQVCGVTRLLWVRALGQSGADRTTGAPARCRRPPLPSRQGSDRR